MSLAQDVIAFGSGSSVVNRVATPLSTIRNRAAKVATLATLIPVATDVSTLLVAYADAVDAKHPSILSSIPVTLPLMQSSFYLDQRLGLTTAESSMSTYFGAISSVETAVESTKTSAVNALTSIASVAVTISGVTGTGDAAITSLLSVVPSPTTTDPGTGTQVTNPAYTTFMSTNSSKISSMTSTLNNLKTSLQTATTQLSGNYASVDSSYQAALSKLKGSAFVSFVNSSHPAEVQAIIAYTLNLSSVPVIP